MEYQENQIKFFKLNQDGREYILSLSIYEDYLRLSCQENIGKSGNYYETDFNLNDLTEINRYFLIMSSIYEAQNELVKAVEKQKVGLELGNNLLNLLIYIIIGTDNVLIKLPLAKRDRAYQRITFPEEQEPFNGDIHLKNKGNYPEDENRIINIEKYNVDLKQSQNGLINDMQNLMDITGKLKMETSYLYEENAKLKTRLKKIQKENYERNLEVDSLKEEEHLLNDENIKLKNYNTELEKLLLQKRENLQKNFLENKQNKLRKGEIDSGNGPKAISSRFENTQVKTFIPRVTIKPKVEAYEESIAIKNKNPFYFTDKRRSNFLSSNYPTDDRINRTDINIENYNNQKNKSFISNSNEFNNSNIVYNKSPDDNYSKKGIKNKVYMEKSKRITEKTNDNEEAPKKISIRNQNILSPQSNMSSNQSQGFNDEYLLDTDDKKEEDEETQQIDDEESRYSNKYMNSDIVKSPMEESMLLNKLGKRGKNIKLKLLYKAVIDSDRAEVFHQKCDKAKTTLVIIETIMG